jgi:lactate dehydrogenase-like 2-hydroxyacid dehydrogenase
LKSHRRIVVTRRIFPEALARLADYDVVDNQDDLAAAEFGLTQRVADATALLTTASDPMGPEIIAAAPKLEVVSTIAVGYNNIALDACRARGIVVTNTPDVLTETTADMGFALLMAIARRITESEIYLREGHWKHWAMEQLLGADIHGSTLGILGMGRIGSAIARRASGFGMRVIYQNRSQAADEQGATRVDKDTLLAESDHLMLVLPYSRETHHSIGAAELDRMKPTATLINIARGGIVDDTALAAALMRGRIAGAALDVYEGEPNVNQALLACRNVVLTPHTGSATRATRMAMCDRAIDNLLAVLEGRPPRDKVA